MRCDECGQINVAGSLFCERCGADLSAPLAGPAASPAADAGWTCAWCDHANPADFVVCEACGRRRDTAPAPPPPEPEAPARRLETGAAPPPPPEPLPEPVIAPPHPPSLAGQLATGPRVGKVKLIVEQGMVVGKQFLLSGPTLLVGREDPSTDTFPDIDLSGLDDGYVHRRHARLTFEGSFLFVTHLGGHNRTYVNNRPIADNLAHPLNVGDTVRFGKVVMRLVEA